MKVKTPRPQLLRKGVVYRVPCKDCGKVYIGEMGRNLKKRLVEHKVAVRRGDAKNGIAVHAWEGAITQGGLERSQRIGSRA